MKLLITKPKKDNSTTFTTKLSIKKLHRITIPNRIATLIKGFNLTPVSKRISSGIATSVILNHELSLSLFLCFETLEWSKHSPEYYPSPKR